MAEMRIVITLRKKRDEVRRAVRNYEKELNQAALGSTQVLLCNCKIYLK